MNWKAEKAYRAEIVIEFAIDVQMVEAVKRQARDEALVDGRPNKIAAIKFLRNVCKEATGYALHLKTAKEIVEDILDQ